MGNYDSLRRFIAKNLLAKDIPLNPLENTFPVVKSITSQFKERGWIVEKLDNSIDKAPLHRLTSPDGATVLSMRGGKVFRHSPTTEILCKYKNLTKKIMELGDVRVPKGADFLPEQREVAMAYSDKLPKPIVIKPTDAAASRGVSVGVNSPESFTAAWAKAQDHVRAGSTILVEQFVRGMEIRAYVVGETTVSTVARLQPFVVGNGKSTITELIHDAKRAREINYRTKRRPIQVRWQFICEQGFHEDSVPKENEIIFLNEFASASMGALSFEVSDLVSSKIKRMAVQAKNCVPGLEIAGVDIIAENLKDPQTAYVTEINTAASPDLHRYATHGRPRSVDTDVVQYFHQIASPDSSTRPGSSLYSAARNLIRKSYSHFRVNFNVRK